MDRNESSIVGAVAVPLLQALISAFLLAVGAYAVAGWLEAEQPVNLALAAFSVAALLAWLFYRGEARSRLDALAGVVELAAPPPAQPVVKEFRLEVVTNNGHTGDLLKLPGGMEKLCELARSVVNGKPFTVRTFTGPSGLYSPTEFDKLRAELLARGFLQWISPHAHTSGVFITSKGMATFRELAAHYPLPQTSGVSKVKQSAW